MDLIERTQGSTTTLGFPLYDAHGNMVATLSRAGTNSYSVNDRRSYDAWGVVRAQQSGGDPKLRYCASLGHKHDDESGLIYMRARYYEPGNGRFVSEDPGRHGLNWFAYCGNEPLGKIDSSGKWDYFSLEAYGASLVERWATYVNMSSMAITEGMGILEFLNIMVRQCVLTQISGDHKAATIALMDEQTILAMERGTPSNSIAKNAIAIIGVYELGLEAAGWLLGLWGPQGPDFEGGG